MFNANNNNFKHGSANAEVSARGFASVNARLLSSGLLLLGENAWALSRL